MTAVARLSDMCRIDCPHGGIGVIVTGSKTTTTDNLATARFSDEVVCTKCGGKFQIITGSPYSTDESLACARIGDMISGTCQYGKKCCNHSVTGEIVTGSDYSWLDDP